MLHLYRGFVFLNLLGIVVLQVRMKAVCVLESILRKRDDEHFSVIASYFSENKDAMVRCTESPQSSLREKSIRVHISHKYVSSSSFTY